MFSSLLWHRCCLYSFSFDIVRFFSINRMEQWCEVCLEAWRAVIISPHKWASRCLFTPTATCYEQTLCWHILATLVGFSLSNWEVPVSCQWWWGSVKLWVAGTVVCLDRRPSEQVCEDRIAGLRLVQLVVWRLGERRLFAHKGTQRPHKQTDLRWEGRLGLIFSQAVKLNSIARGQWHRGITSEQALAQTTLQRMTGSKTGVLMLMEHSGVLL